MSASFGEWGSSFSSRIVRSPLTGDVAWLLFEYCITLDREVHYAWCRQLTWPRAIFFLNRYISLLHSVFGMASAFLPVSFFVSLLTPHTTALQWLIRSLVEASPVAQVNSELELL